MSSSDVGAAASTSANGEMLTSHLPSGFAPRDVEPSRKNEQSLSANGVGPSRFASRKSVHSSESRCEPNSTERPPPTKPSAVSACLLPRVHSTLTAPCGTTGPVKVIECTCTSYWYLSCDEPRCGRFESSADARDGAADEAAEAEEAAGSAAAGFFFPKLMARILLPGCTAQFSAAPTHARGIRGAAGRGGSAASP